MPKHVIRYRYPGTVNDQPVGLVYAQDVSHICGKGAWSYTKDPQQATHFDSREAAECERDRHYLMWREGEVLELGEVSA